MAEQTAAATPRLNYVLCTNPRGWHRMAYWEWGAADNDHVLLCVHGLTRNGRDVDTLAQQFSKQYRVVCPDMVGRGASDWLEDPDHYGFAQYVGDIATLLARLRPRRVTWLGTSMGGLIGLSVNYMLGQTAAGPLIQDSALHPLPKSQEADWLNCKSSPIDKLILNDIGPELALEGMRQIGRAAEQAQSFASFEAACDFAQQHWSGFGLQNEAQWQAYTRHYFVSNDSGQWQPHYDPAIIKAYVRGLAYPMEESQKFLWTLYQQLTIPVLILRGAQSNVLSSAVYQRMLDEQPLAQGWENTQAGHAPSLLQPEELAKIQRLLTDQS